MNAKQCVRAVRAGMSLGWRGPSLLVGFAAAALSSPAVAQPSVGGEWGPPPVCPPYVQYEWPHKAVTMIHLATGDILFWQFDGATAKLWNRTTGCFTGISSGSRLFCAGQVALSNGDIVVAGGDTGPPPNESGEGINEVTIYRLGAAPIGSGPWDNSVAQMNHARWYPTCTTLPDGRVLALSGNDENGQRVLFPEIYDPVTDTWSPISPIDPQLALPTYPFMFVLPDGTVFAAGGGHDLGTYILDLQAGTWTFLDNSNFGGRAGSAVLYEPGKVLKSGGLEGNCATIIPYTDIIDLSDPNNPGQWDSQFDWDMINARWHHTLVMLPDGTILAVGGENDCDLVGNDCVDCVAVYEAELFDPNVAFPTWRPMASMQFDRRAHSTALLLPDGRVLVAGAPNHTWEDCTDCNSAEIFSPPYLFWGERPVIGYAPTVVKYGTLFRVVLTTTGAPPPIGTVSLLRLAAVTHSFDQDQRYVPLTFTVPYESALDVDAPANANLAPPGYYMLFVVSQDGVPSVATYVRLE